MQGLYHGRFAHWTVSPLISLSTHWSFTFIDVLSTKVDKSLLFWLPCCWWSWLNECRAHWLTTCLGCSVYSADVTFWHRLSTAVAFDNTSGSRCCRATDRIRQQPELYKTMMIVQTLRCYCSIMLILLHIISVCCLAIICLFFCFIGW